MIFTQGNLLDSTARALVNTVNTVGVMGKGIALQFREAYPHNFRVYRQACSDKAVAPGKMLVVEDQDLTGPRTIINFPTKRHWRGRSRLEWIESGLDDLRRVLEDGNIPGVAIPPLGCGNGGLDWAVVRPLIEQKLAGIVTEVIVYEPSDRIRMQLREKAPEQPVVLNPARAMLLEAMHRYEDDFEPVSLFVANKLVYFLKLLGGPFDRRVTFTKHYYGPYAPAVNHVVYRLNGTYLTGLEQNAARPFDALSLNYHRYPEITRYLQERLSPEENTVLENLNKLLAGYKSAYALEVLATVDFIRREQPDLAVAGIVAEARRWSPRKAKLLRPEYVARAVAQLDAYANQPLS